MLTRRGFLVAGGLGAAAVAAGAAVGDHVASGHGVDTHATLRRALGLGSQQHEERFASRYRRADVTWVAAVPHGVDPRGLPMALALHGRGGDARSVFDGIHVDDALADHVRAGGRPFAVVAVDGGDHGYWHPRADGTDALRMITDELLPRVAAFGLRTDRIATMGWSMGGFGSLMLARESAQGRLRGTTVVASAASAAALWPSAGLTAPGAFDSPADFERWGDLVADPGIDGRVPLHVDCGDRDPFAPTVRNYRAAVRPTPAGGFVPGTHDTATWRPMLPAQLTFLAHHLHA